MRNRYVIRLLIILCFLFALPFFFANLPRNSSFWYGNDPVLSPHRDDFSPDIPREVYTAFGPGTDVLKVYPSLPRTTWFLDKTFADFSQIVTAQPYYIVQSSENAYTSYSLSKDGTLTESGTALVSHTTRPYGLIGLTSDMIQTALSGIDYDDYIITDSSAVIVWVRREQGDLFLTYPTRPDLMGIAVGKLYTLEELQDALAAAYEKE